MSSRLRSLVVAADIPGREKADMLVALALIAAVVEAARKVCDSIFIESWNQKGWSWFTEPVRALKRTIQLLDGAYDETAPNEVE